MEYLTSHLVSQSNHLMSEQCLKVSCVQLGKYMDYESAREFVLLKMLSQQEYPHTAFI